MALKVKPTPVSHDKETLDIASNTFQYQASKTTDEVQPKHGDEQEVKKLWSQRPVVLENYFKKGINKSYI